ncbi:MAG TPA: hypothetical protein VMN39_03580 [Longimicrobiaceae bacterium]|nr:hypothetical protein [Longimicrobiaceae bacterium]
MKGALKILAATALFAVGHSLLASRSAKRAAGRLLGTEGRDALYRPFYLAQSVVMFGGLLWYLQRQPRRTLYRVPQPWATLMRVGQAGGIMYAAHAVHHVGVARLLGLPGVGAWLTGGTVPAPAEAQGPAYVGGAMKATGAFRWHRHPLNFAPLPVLWLFPHMTSRLAAMNLASTAYLVLGSMLEETRLRSAYGAAYERYQTSVPFYAPRSPSRGAVSTGR